MYWDFILQSVRKQLQHAVRRRLLPTSFGLDPARPALRPPPERSEEYQEAPPGRAASMQRYVDPATLRIGRIPADGARRTRVAGIIAAEAWPQDWNEVRSEAPAPLRLAHLIMKVSPSSRQRMSTRRTCHPTTRRICRHRSQVRAGPRARAAVKFSAAWTVDSDPSPTSAKCANWALARASISTPSRCGPAGPDWLRNARRRSLKRPIKSSGS
jgi:hypothetical protein